MKKPVFNPYLPSWEYVPDGEPHVFGNRLYVFGSHDRFNGTQFCMNDYVCWSCPIDDLSDWQCSGTIYRKAQDPHADRNSIMQAPDVAQGRDGRYYLYYALGLKPFVSVAVCDTPDGQYRYLGVVSYADGTPLGLKDHDVFAFDPGLLVDDDGRCYLYVGFGPEEKGFFAAACKKYRMDGAYALELCDDMLTLKADPIRIVPKAGAAEGAGFEGHEFFEASSMRKISGKYYFIYSSVLSHELCYAVSDFPDRGFTFGGTLVSIGDIGYQGNHEPLNYMGNTHGSLVQVKRQWYVFYHRQTNRHNFSRQGCAEPVAILPDGRIPQVEITSQGLNNGPLPGKGRYPAYIACNLWSGHGALTYGTASTPEAKDHPYLTQSGADRERDGDQYIANIRDGATVGFKYFDLSRPTSITLCIGGDCEGVIEIRSNPKSGAFCSIPVLTTGQPCDVSGRIPALTNSSALYMTFIGRGYCDLHAFEFGHGLSAC